MDLIEKLQGLGIPKREAEIYLALLHKKEFSAGEISKITSISRNKSYEILQSLVKKGLCCENYRNGIKVFSCIKPKTVIGNITSDFDKKKKTAYELEKELTEIFDKNGTDDSPVDYIEVLTDKTKIKERYESIEIKTSKELLGFTIPPYIISDALSDNVEKQAEILRKKKIKMRCLYEFCNNSPQELENLIKTIELYQKTGEEARIVKKLPMKLVVSDGMITMLALKDRVSLKPSMTTLIIEHQSFAEALKEVFESYWSKGITIKEFKRNKKKYLSNE
ncbi:MAG: helix-turn-helix domain-containing protein [Ignavibacteria bacterium]|jgi:HTH-type transcriptional regulator, sugar sensing transcriptional regulator|nr:helix-turn-helix domain-containing protein [Ignavibacteria bacterium]